MNDIIFRPGTRVSYWSSITCTDFTEQVGDDSYFIDSALLRIFTKDRVTKYAHLQVDITTKKLLCSSICPYYTHKSYLPYKAKCKIFGDFGKQFKGCQYHFGERIMNMIALREL